MADRELEQILQRNADRRRWETEEYTDFGVPDKVIKKANRRKRTLRTASLACATAMGIGATMIGIGIGNGVWSTAVSGGIISAVFLFSGWFLELMSEEDA